MTDVAEYAPKRKDRGARKRILGAANNLFHNQGIHVTGMQELAEEAGVSKRTLYKHFPKKDDLVLQYLRQQELEDEFEIAALDDTNATPRERLLGIFDAMSPEPGVTGTPRGCMFLNAAVEIPEPSHPAHVLVREHKQRFAQRLARIAAEAGAADPKSLGDELALLYDGAASRSVALGSASATVVARRLAEAIIDAQLGSGARTLGVDL